MGRKLFSVLVAVAIGGGAFPGGAAAGTPSGIAQSFPTHCGVESLVAGHEGNVWFACVIETNYGYGSKVRVGRVTPAGQVSEFGASLPKNENPGQIVVDANGDLWLPLSPWYLLLHAKPPPPKIARITPDGTVTTYDLGLTGKDGIGQVVASPNGYLWFLTVSGKTPSLWQISPQGTIARLPIDLAGTPQPGLAVGPEGNLWLTKKPASGPAEQAIARLTPEGVLTEFGADVPGFAPEPPILSPDGAFWFFKGTKSATLTSIVPDAIGRITASGAITEVAKLDLAGGIVGGATIGAEGNLWFGFQSGALGQSAIERVTPTGSVTPFRDCLRYSQPWFGPDMLATAADGDIWFTSVASRQLPGITDPPSIGRITPGGEITQIYAGVDSEPHSILAGPDGAIWFSGGGEEIQRIAPLTAPVNTFHVAPLRRAASSGAATARVAVPGPGTIELKPLALLLPHHRRAALHGRSVTASAASCTTARVPVKPVGAALKRFRRRGEAREQVAVTFTPAGGTPYTETARLYFFAPRR